jgi:hypothetical protein
MRLTVAMSFGIHSYGTRHPQNVLFTRSNPPLTMPSPICNRPPAARQSELLGNYIRSKQPIETKLQYPPWQGQCCMDFSLHAERKRPRVHTRVRCEGSMIARLPIHKTCLVYQRCLRFLVQVEHWMAMLSLLHATPFVLGPDIEATCFGACALLQCS